MPTSDASLQLIRSARRQPMLSADEERALAERSLAGDVQAAQALALSHMRVVVMAARRYARLGPALDDLVQEGLVGLMHATRRFHPENGARFATYARWWIRSTMQDHVVRNWSLVRPGKTSAHRSLFFSLRKLARSLLSSAEMPGEATLLRLAASFRLSIGEVRDLAARIAASDLSLSRPRFFGAGTADSGPEAAPDWQDEIASPLPGPEQIAEERSLQSYWKGLVERSLDRLPGHEALVIRRRHLAESRISFENIGRELGLSRDRVRQIEASAMKRLRTLLGGTFNGCFSG
jgi:RNA polymerase sigma-32 factor